MKTKHILTAMVLPALFAACTSEDVALENNAKVDLSNRPVLSNVTLSINNADTRLSVAEGSDYAIRPDENDGLGACIIDVPKYTAADYASTLEAAGGDATKLYDIKECISSNYRYSYDASTGAWSTQALLSEGNYIFYAPHSETHLVRTPLSVKVPVEQNATKAEPNKAVKEYYANASKEGYPVLIDYKFLSSVAQEKNVAINYRHIMAYPKFTLKNAYTEYDETAKKEIDKPVTITKIVFTLANNQKFTVEAPMLNGETASTGIAKKALGGENPLWINREIEEAATSDIMNTTAGDKVVKTSNEIAVNFGDGLKLAAKEEFSFYAVLPAENYTTNKLVATVYTVDNKQFETSFTLGALTLNPGKRYPAQEYNTRMNETDELELKPTKGSLATITLSGKQVEVAAKATGLLDNKQLITYLAEVATRYRDLKQVNDAFVMSNIYTVNSTDLANGYVKYDKGLHFTLAPEAKITINDDLIDALNKYIYTADGQGSITFLAEDVATGKVVIGQTTKLDAFKINFSGAMNTTSASFVTEGLDDKKYIKFAANKAPDGISLSAGVTELTDAKVFGITSLKVPTGATLNLVKGLANATNLTIVNDGGTINVAGNVIVAGIKNNKGTLNLNGDNASSISNGALELKEDGTVQGYTDAALTIKNTNAVVAGNFVKVISNGTINIAADVDVKGTVVNHLKSTINNNGFLTDDNHINGGIIVMSNNNAFVKVKAYTYTNYTGTINNNIQAAITKSNVTGQNVACTLSTVPTGAANVAKFQAAAINSVTFTGDVELAAAVFKTAGDVFYGVTSMHLNGNITTKEVLDGASAVDFYFYNDATWTGVAGSMINMSSSIIQSLNVKKGKSVIGRFVTLPTSVEFE